MPEKIEIDLYQFITRELEKLEARIDRRFDEQRSQMVEQNAQTNAQMNERFKELKEEVRWPRRIAIAGVITTVMAVGFAIIGFKS
ncbi:hypothetical protein AGMMS49944_22940 [Spirochaetia bacterium]|nr:hypothetical protein AGMMS49944_22940 [Spirochaetia bacterium]